jgi:glycosyltransferase involved in cell wall biosynthesis
LVIPSLGALSESLGQPIEVGFLSEERRGAAAFAPVQYAESFGLKTFQVAVRSPLDFRSISALAEVLIKKQPAIVHAHDVKASTYLAAATAYLRACGPRRRALVSWKLVSTHHGIHARSGAKVRGYELFYSYAVLKLFDRILCVCTSDRDILISRGLKASRVFVHLNGVDRPEVPENARAERQRMIRHDWENALGISLQGKIVLGIAARLSAEKNHSLLLDALRFLKERTPDLSWICVCFGQGPLDRMLREKTERLGLRGQVHWAGYRKDLSAEMAGFDLLISLSRGEGLPINLLEAGWSRTPVLAVAVDGVQDLLPLSDPELRLLRLEPPAQIEPLALHIQQLMTQPVQLRNLSDRLYRRVSFEFSGQMWRSCMVKIYQTFR